MQHYESKRRCGKCIVFSFFFFVTSPLFPRRQEGNCASPGAGAGRPDQAPAPIPASPWQRQEWGGSVPAEEMRLCFEQEERGRGAGAAAQGESDTPAGSEAVQEARADPEAAERWTDSGRQRHAGLAADGGNLFISSQFEASNAQCEHVRSVLLCL